MARMFIAALLAMVKINKETKQRKSSKQQSKVQWINNLWHSHTMGYYYSAMKIMNNWFVQQHEWLPKTLWGVEEASHVRIDAIKFYLKEIIGQI